LNKILNEGEYTIGEIVEALQLEIHQKKEDSVKTGQNKLKYQQNSLTYLNQQSYIPFVDLIRAGHKVKTENKEYDGINI
jgi:UDP-3-O-[3-hydroxymyristoyl] glucosamine N-acyltransferase